MIYSVTAENEAGEQLEMRLACPQFSGMNIYDIAGLGTPKADILTSDSPNVQGSIYNSARAKERNIVMHIKFVDSDFSSGGLCTKPDDVVGVCTDSYDDLVDKPQINSVELVGNKRGEELGLQNEMMPIPMPTIEKWLKKYWDGDEIIT